MSQTATLLDQAYEIGREELGALAEGDVDAAERLAQNRGELLGRVLNQEGVCLEQMLDKLQQLQKLQGMITSEARKLRESIREDLQRARQEGKRLGGYGEARRGYPTNRPVYLNKCG